MGISLLRRQIESLLKLGIIVLLDILRYYHKELYVSTGSALFFPDKGETKGQGVFPPCPFWGSLLQFYGSAGFFDFSFGCFGVFLVDFFLDVAGNFVNQGFCFFEA